MGYFWWRAETALVLPANVLIEEDEDEMVLMLGGKNKNISRRNFLELAESYGLSGKTGERMILEVVRRKDLYLEMIGKSLPPKDLQGKLSDLIIERTMRIG